MDFLNQLFRQSYPHLLCPLLSIYKWALSIYIYHCLLIQSVSGRLLESRRLAISALWMDVWPLPGLRSDACDLVFSLAASGVLHGLSAYPLSCLL